jgi:hypothetical protein
MRMTDDEARDIFTRIRWSANDGELFCPRFATSAQLHRGT